jgi:hypothetical protein
VEPPAATVDTGKSAIAAVGAATRLTQLESPAAAEASAAPPAKAALSSNRSADVASGPDALWWLVVIACGLIGVYAAGRLVFDPIEPHRR